MTNERRDELVRALTELMELYGRGDEAGMRRTEVEHVSLVWARADQPRTLVTQRPGLLLLGQGSMRAFEGGRVIAYDAHTFMVTSTPLAMEVEFLATPEEPMLGLFLDIDLMALCRMIELIGEDMPQRDGVPGEEGGLGAQPAPMDTTMSEAMLRLALYLCDELLARTLAPGAVDELVFHVLMGEHGATLQQLTRSSSKQARIARSLSIIHGDLEANPSVEALAREANMGTSTFHRVFKAQTGESPLRYIKRVKLAAARRMLRSGDLGVAEVAARVGYESASRFARDFKRAFGVSPSQDIA